MKVGIIGFGFKLSVIKIVNSINNIIRAKYNDFTG